MGNSTAIVYLDMTQRRRNFPNAAPETPVNNCCLKSFALGTTTCATRHREGTSLEHHHVGISQLQLEQSIIDMASLYILAVPFFVAFAALYKTSISRDCCTWFVGVAGHPLVFQHFYALALFRFLGVDVDNAFGHRSLRWEDSRRTELLVH